MAARRASRDFPPVAWISLETSDNDPVRFWRYLITACQTFQVDLQEAYSALLDTTPQPPFVPSSLCTVLTILLNALARCSSRGILVLEDYHVITSQEVHETISFFLDHLPATIHLIMITRSEPPFSLARLRARNELYEVRTADLRFSQEETTILLQQSLSFPLEASTIQRLHAQLEGWGAGLHLMKLALQRTTTQASEEQRLPLFLGSNSSFQEYFITEVLDLQPEPVQRFLLQTSILTRLTGSLCDAVAEQQNSQDLLTLLERANLFLEPLDTTGQWYRYHALFAETMRNEARRRIGEDQLYHLSARASHWYEVHGFLSEAIDAALYAQDYVRAAILIERSVEMQTSPGEMNEYHTLHRWLEQLPETILKQRPVLCLSYATTLLFLSTSWQPDQLALHLLERLLQMAEQCFHSETNLPKLGELFAFRSLLAWRQDEVQQAAMYARQALTWLREAQQLWRGLSLGIVGIELFGAGELQRARTTLLEAHALCKAVKNHYFKRVTTICLAQLFFEQGELQRASTYYHQALPEAREHGPISPLCYVLIGLAAISYEWNELETAHQHAQEILALSQQHPDLEFHEVHATLLLTRIQQAQGQVIAAQQQLAALLARLPAFSSQLSEEIQTAQARLALAVGDHMTMQRWVTGRQQHNLPSQEAEELLLARWLRTQDKHEEAFRLLERLLVAAQKTHHVRRILEIQVEMVLIYAACKQKAEAQQLLREVLLQAFDSNYVRLFLDAGENMAVLLRSLLSQMSEKPLLAYLHTLLHAFPVSQHMLSQTLASPLIEPLSAQERRVLRLLIQNHSNAEIARELVVSVNTVRSQVQSIYRKLDVHTRNAASEVARHLNLL
jgi:LuxR family maltose regulon positive regulatory protein